jgi:hypothetical protein
MSLYQHIKHEHKPVNVALLHKAKLDAAGFNKRLAVLLTKLVSSMPTAYIFTMLSIIGLLGLLGWLNPFIFLLATWISQQFLQLVFLPILAVGQSVLSEHQELQAEEQFNTTMKAEHEITEIANHLSAQDTELLRQTTELLKQTPMLAEILTVLKEQPPARKR